MPRRCAFRRWIASSGPPFLLLLCLGGFACSARRPLPAHVQYEVAELTASLESPASAPAFHIPYFAAVRLGTIGLDYDLPPRAFRALETLLADKNLAYYNPNIPGVGSGELRLTSADGARAAYLMWSLRTMRTDAERAARLWCQLADPACGDGMAMFCIEELIQIEDAAAVPCLFAVAADYHGGAGWYVRGLATRRLGHFLPQSRGLLVLLARCGETGVESVATETLGRDAVNKK